MTNVLPVIIIFSSSINWWGRLYCRKHLQSNLDMATMGVFVPIVYLSDPIHSVSTKFLQI